MKSICIFCGSSKGNEEIFSQAAEKYVQLLVRDGVRVVYGAGSIGIMGVVAQTVLKHKGTITGIAPHFLAEKEVVHQGLSELILVRDMFERKMKLIEQSDGFAILPGGIGTLDEFFEVLTALQLELIHKPVGILNIEGYFTPLLEMLNMMVKKRFYRAEHLAGIIVESDPDIFHKKLIQHKPEPIESWINDLKKTQHF